MSRSSRKILPSLGPNQAHSHVKSGRFSGSIWPEQTHDFTLIYFHRNIVHNSAALVLLNEILRVQFHRSSESEHQRDTHTKCLCLRTFEMGHSPECIHPNNLENVLHCDTRFKIRPMKPRILITPGYN
jgi:hypothetical protein